MSWASCMEHKIVDKYGPEVETCVQGISEGNLKDVAKCIADALGNAVDPLDVFGDLTKWALECAF